MRRSPLHRAVRVSHRGRRALAVALAVGLLPAGVALTAVDTAQAAAAGPTVHLTAGNRAVTAAWSRVAGATSYTVRYATKASLAGAHSVRTTEQHVQLDKLHNGTRYFVAVTADRATGTVSPASAVAASAVHATPAAGYPYPVSDVRASPAGPDQVQVTWSGGGRATKVGVIAGGESTTTSMHFRSAWYPATTHSVTLTVPAKYQKSLGAGTGNYVFVRVVESNSTAAKPAMHLRYDIGDAYRISTLASSALAGSDPAPAAGDRLKVAEMNVQSYTATEHFSTTNQWKARKARIAKTVLASKADLFLTSELDTHRIDAKCVNHWKNTKGPHSYCETALSDLVSLLDSGPKPLKAATGDAYKQVLKVSADHPSLGGKITSGAQIFYDPAKMTLESHGFLSPALDLGIRQSGVQDRWWSWAKFKLVSGREFYAVAVHLPAMNSGTNMSALHAAVTTAAAAYLARLNSANLPVVIGGDFNSDPIRNARPATAILVNTGYTDAAAAPKRAGARYATFNGHNGGGGVDPGYPVTAVPHRYNTSRIDFILTHGNATSYSYKNVLHIDGNRFQKSYQGSDHNLQLASIGIGDPQ